MQDSALKYLVIALTAACAVAMLAQWTGRSQPQQRGWKLVTPGAMHWTAVFLSGGLTLLMAYVWLFIGSSRPDGAFQMKVLFWLIVAFGTGSIIAGFSCRAIIRRGIRWRGQAITYNGPTGEVTHRFDEISDARNTLRGFVINFGEGHLLRVDPNAAGAQALIDAVLASRGESPDEDRED
ncbi:hypothetical protein [Aestuariivirga sp.]|uniref:hypothetical protein n=1 Tax=Aestuariivirga sp. TaxID=2650926 RepID=UPI0035942F0F